MYVCSLLDGLSTLVGRLLLLRLIKFVLKQSFSPLSENQSSFEVDYNILGAECSVLAFFLPEAPTEVLQILDESAKSVVLSMFPHYERISKEIHVRISGKKSERTNFNSFTVLFIKRQTKTHTIVIIKHLTRLPKAKEYDLKSIDLT